jgi:hypothetical protein
VAELRLLEIFLFSSVSIIRTIKRKRKKKTGKGPITMKGCLITNGGHIEKKMK